MEEKIMLNLLDLHKRAKATFNTDPQKVAKDMEQLEKSLIVNKSPDRK